MCTHVCVMCAYIWQSYAQDNKIALDIASDEKVKEEIWKNAYELQVSTTIGGY